MATKLKRGARYRIISRVVFESKHFEAFKCFIIVDVVQRVLTATVESTSMDQRCGGCSVQRDQGEENALWTYRYGTKPTDESVRILNHPGIVPSFLNFSEARGGGSISCSDEARVG
jgi:hypothetical protein